MHRHALLLLALPLGAPLAAAAQADCATVEVHNVRARQGQLMVAAYGDAETFNNKPLAALRVPAGEAISRLRLCGLAGPEVAVVMYQDLDGNGQMNKNLLGVPTEPWGSSGRYGAFGPRWDTAKVTFDGGSIVVRLTP
jgi:uncharacterized protein (DUF2141 family)